MVGRFVYALVVLLGLTLTACAAPATPMAAPMLAATLSPLTQPTPSEAAYSPPGPSIDWLSVAPGFERRELPVSFSDGSSERVILFRIDPALHRFRVLYSPAQPALVSQWERNARLVVNAGFFDENNAALGLLVSDGQFFGQSYVDFGGMFAVSGETPSVRSLSAEPYQPGEALEQAAQSFPMLFRPDGTVFANEDGVRARRTAIGVDEAGRVLVIIAPRGGFTLAQLAAWLRDGDLGLTAALNLDGGGSTGYYAGPNDAADSFTPVPAVIVVYDH